MSDCPPSGKSSHLEHGLVKFPPNVHGIYVEPQETGDVRLTVRQNEVRLSFVLDEGDCKHLASLLLREVR